MGERDLEEQRNDILAKVKEEKLSELYDVLQYHNLSVEDVLNIIDENMLRTA